MGRLSWLWLSVLVVVIDQASKFYFENSLSLYQQIVVIPSYFSWTLAYNTGAAFSFLADSSGWQRWLFALIAVVVSAVLVTWHWCWAAPWAICTTALPSAMSSILCWCTGIPAGTSRPSTLPTVRSL
jgi:lipoprotein signal peptidase